MAKKGNWVTCDLTSTIINDGVTIISGYVSIRDGVMYRYTTNDPMNELARYKPWILHNRVQYIKTTQRACKIKKLQGKDFISKSAAYDFLTIKNN